jgi:hypothetical protein
LHTAFSLPYIYNYIKKYTGNKQKSYKIIDERVRSIGSGEAIHRKYKRLKLGGGQARIGQEWNAYSLLVVKPQGKLPVGRPGYGRVQYQSGCYRNRLGLYGLDSYGSG